MATTRRERARRDDLHNILNREAPRALEGFALATVQGLRWVSRTPPRSMRFPPRILVLDIGASHVAGALIAVKRNKTLILERFAQTGISGGNESSRDDMEAQALALVQLIVGEKWRGACIVAVPGHQVLVKYLTVPKVGSIQQREIVKFEAAQAMPFPLEEMCWGSQRMSHSGPEDEFVVAAAKATVVETLCVALTVARLRTERIMPGSLALWQTWRRAPSRTDGTVLLVDIGARSTQLVFATIECGRVRILAIGGNIVSQEIAEALGLGFAEAEVLKIRVLREGEGVPTTVDPKTKEATMRAVDRFSKRLGIELSRAMAGQARLPASLPVVEVLMTGGGALMPGLAEKLGQTLDLPVRRFDGLSDVVVGARAKQDGAMAAPHRLAVLIGLAEAVREGKSSTLNLLPAAIRQERARRSARAWWLATAALLVLAAVPPVMHLHARASALRTDNQRLQSELRPLRELAARNAVALERLTAMQRETAALRRVIAAKSSWRGFLAAVQVDLLATGDVWLERMEVVAGQPERHDAPKPPSLRLAVSGRLLDVQNPQSKISPAGFARVKELLTRMAAGRFVEAVVDERFDNSRPGMLRFDFTLVLKPEPAL